jgi:hypothetical protein
VPFISAKVLRPGLVPQLLQGEAVQLLANLDQVLDIILVLSVLVLWIMGLMLQGIGCSGERNGYPRHASAR